jgi:hypothetical protein
MSYVLIALTLVIAIAGLFKDTFPQKYRTLITILLGLILIISSLTQCLHLYREQVKAKYLADTGKLKSGVKSTSRRPILELGTSKMAIEGDPSEPIIAIGDDSIFVHMADGEAKISMIIRDEHGIVREMVRDNVWFVPRSEGILDKNFTDDTLEVIGQTGDIILQLHVEGEIVHLFATTHLKGGGPSVYFGPGFNESNGRADTVFMYPSLEYPGKRKQQ